MSAMGDAPALLMGSDAVGDTRGDASDDQCRVTFESCGCWGILIVNGSRAWPIRRVFCRFSSSREMLVWNCFWQEANVIGSLLLKEKPAVS